MKKSILTIGLFSLIMILTSFTTPETVSQSVGTNANDIGGTITGGNKKVDIGGTITGGNKKVDIGGTITGGNKKVD